MTVVNTIILVVISITGILLFHNFGHYIAAKAYGLKLSYHLEWKRIWVLSIPSIMWKAPENTSHSQLEVINSCGSLVEIATAVIIALGSYIQIGTNFALVYCCIVVLHMFAYTAIDSGDTHHIKK